MSVRSNIRTTAMLALIIYAIVRFIFAQAILKEYGVNPWVFLAIDTITAVIYVLGIEYLVVSLRAQIKSWPKLCGWAAATFVAFAAPYAYIYQSSRELPWAVGVGLAAVIALLLANALWGVHKRIKINRQ